MTEFSIDSEDVNVDVTHVNDAVLFSNNKLKCNISIILASHANEAQSTAAPTGDLPQFWCWYPVCGCVFM